MQSACRCVQGLGDAQPVAAAASGSKGDPAAEPVSMGALGLPNTIGALGFAGFFWI